MSLAAARELNSTFLEFLESLESRIDSCSCVVVSRLSATEEPRQKKSHGGHTFTHHQNSQQHFGESAHRTLEDKKTAKNGVKQVWDLIRDFELPQFIESECDQRPWT